MNDIQLEIIFETFEKILGPTSTGALAYIKFFDASMIARICEQDRPSINGWMVHGVGALDDSDTRLISADQAVEIRENKNESTLLLVDTRTAGAGMDGIYTSGREIKESAFFKLANEIARKRLGRGAMVIAKKAVSKARHLANRGHIAPYQIFKFYSKCAELNSVGTSIAYLGLWPVSENGKLEEYELDMSAKMVEKLFLQTNSIIPATTLIEALVIKDATDKQRTDLIDIIHSSSSKSWKESALSVIDKPQLWLNKLNPGIFDLDNLQTIEIISWRSRNQKPAAWSGLTSQKDSDLLEYVIDREVGKKNRASKLEIRWKTSPEDLAKGACEYSVEIVSGYDVLAEKRITHCVKNPQKISFTSDDFESIDENAKFEARVLVKAIGDQDIEARTEDFVLRFGSAEERTRSSSASVQRSLVEAAIAIESREDFEIVMREHQNPCYYSHDKKGYITFRYRSKSGKVFCPPLLKTIEKDWVDRNGAVGRWKIKIRADGDQVGKPEFIEIPPDCSDSLWTRLCQSSAKICDTLKIGQGMLGMIYGPDKGFENYINSWMEVIENSEPSAVLAGTVEVQSLNGETLGLIVLPIHPVRMAWHQGYDMLLKFARYEMKLTPQVILDVAKNIVGSYFPAFLPGLVPGKSFVFGDVLNFHFVAMVADDDAEPKASVAMMGRALSDGKQFIDQSVALANADALSTEIVRYVRLHPYYDTLHIHALRPGDSMTLGRALGKSLEVLENRPFTDEDSEPSEKRGFVLELFPSSSKASIVGKYFTSVAEGNRSGFTSIPREDRWIIENRQSPGGVRRPKLVWAKRQADSPQSSAHLAVAFDTFDSSVQIYPCDQLRCRENSLEVYGLVLNRNRFFDFTPVPNWKTFVAIDPEGEKHPAARGLTERLIKIHRSILRMTAINLGGSAQSWPVLSAQIPLDKEESLSNLHHLCDWVITIDRNAGIEYFDSPKGNFTVYEAYIIECVPAREDLGFLQLVTSTSNFEEIEDLLEETLATMGVSSRPISCEFLMNQLKSLSGRLVMRLAAGGNVAQEMVAIAYTNARCLESALDSDSWLSVKKGFLLPIDDVPQFLGLKSDSEDFDKTRSDFLYVSTNPKGGLQFTFVEIRYRRHLRTARSNELIKEITTQLNLLRDKWEKLHGDSVSPFPKAVNRSKLARILTFYVEKGLRHNLEQDAYDKIINEINRMLRDGERYILERSEEATNLDRGYIFCPEYLAQDASDISYPGGPRILLFGPNSVSEKPEINHEYFEELKGYSKSETSTLATADQTTLEIVPNQVIESTQHLPRTRSNEALVTLGKSEYSDDLTSWKIDIKGNPHLMVVGLPGMGKTTCLVNLCFQMIQAGISPIIFSYHDDVDTLLQQRLGDSLQFVDYAGLGFNPLEVVADNPHAYVDNVSMIRDIFKAIFPDLGDIQLGALREALKRSYMDLGWADYDGKSDRPKLPQFQAFYDILSNNEKKETGLLTRLTELNDYEFFRNITGAKSLLDLDVPSVIRIHKAQNETLQRAFATFVLYNLYQRMFQRGPRGRITHAIIFDEAHRAARLKLIPKMIKECRKFGIAFVMASQEAKDFDQSVYSAIANFLVLRLTENDAKVISKVIASSDQINKFKDRLKTMPKYHALFAGEGTERPTYIALQNL